MRFANGNATIADLKHILSSQEADLYNLIHDEDRPKLIKDLSKIYLLYDWENSGLIEEDVLEHCNAPLHQYEWLNGLAVAWCYGCDGSDIPFVFVLYFDEVNDLRAYIPNKGNCYNREHHQPYIYSEKTKHLWKYDVDLLRKDVEKHIQITFTTAA